MALQDAAPNILISAEEANAAEAKDFAAGSDASSVSSATSVAGDIDAISVDSEELEENIEECLAARPSGLSVEQELAWWYSCIQPVCRDVCDELGGNESALINGESLVLRFCCGLETIVDGEVKPHFLCQPRSLEIIFKIEAFIAKLNEVGFCNYRIVFFDCLQACLIRRHPLLWTVRNLLRLHCDRNPESMPQSTYADWYQKEYIEFLDTQKPFVMLVEDGSHLYLDTVSDLGKMMEPDDDDGDGQGGDGNDSSTTPSSPTTSLKKIGSYGLSALYLLSLSTIGQQTSVCFLYNLQFVTRRIKTWSIGYEQHSAILESQVKNKVLKEEADAISRLEEALEETDENVNKFFKDDRSESRLDILSRVATDILNDPENDEGCWSALFFKCLLLHDYLLKNLGLDDRLCNLAPVQSETYDFTFEFLGWYMSKHMENLSLCQTLNPREIVDMFDELAVRRVLYYIIKCWLRLGKPSSLSASDLHLGDEIHYIEERWESLYNEKFFPIKTGEDFEEELGGNILDGKSPDDDKTWLNQNTSKFDFSTILPEENDFVSQMIGEGDDRVIPAPRENLNEDDDVVEKFRSSLNTNADFYTPSDLTTNDTDPSSSSVVPQKCTRFDLTPGNDTYDYGVVHINSNAKSVNTRPLPKWMSKYSGDALDRAIKKWTMKCIQENRKYARDLNKYMGNLDRLHRPIASVPNQCSSDHPWYKEPRVSGAGGVGGDDDNTAVTSTAKASKKKVDEKSKLGSKANAIIEKNKEVKGEKMKKKDNDGYDQLMSHCEFIFKKKTDNIVSFQTALLELLLGSRNAADTTVLESFGAVDKAILIPENRLAFLTSIAQHLLDPLDSTWRAKTIAAKGQEKHVIKFIGLIFRFVQVTTDKYLNIMEARHIEIFQTILLVLGFANSARVLFNKWALLQWQKKNNRQQSSTPDQGAAQGDDAAKKKKKAGKPGAGQGGKSSKQKIQSNQSTTQGGLIDDEGEEAMNRQKALYIKKLESQHRVMRANRSFDFAVRPEIEMTFQMEYLGSDMTRSLGSCQDPRVPFLPDSWQKKLLDTVDSSESALVVAPTSSGKTFICYYAMEQVLRYDNESCVVFVSPTRALALQVESEVISRFSAKSFPPGVKTVLNGHLFDDRQQDWDNCQILIAVPSAFEAVLSSTDPTIRAWQKKLKYVIIDEVHCIGDEKIGRDCENLVQLLPCPFMALSATVGNELDFNRWLANAQSALRKPKSGNGNRVRFIKYSERYADLQTFYYSGDSHSLYNLNPILCVNYERVKSGTLNGDFALVPPDCLQVYRVLSSVLSAKLPVADWSPVQRQWVEFFIEWWNPELYFANTQAITKRQYGRYVKSITQTIESFVRQGVLDDKLYDEVLARIGDAKPIRSTNVEPWYKVTAQHQSIIAKAEEAEVPTDSATVAEVLVESGSHVSFNNPSTFLGLIRNLESRKLLPALVFNFNRAFSSRLFYRLVNKLISDHRDKFYGTPELAAATRALNKQRQDQYKAELQRRELAEKWKSLSKQQREEQGIDERLLAEVTGGPPPAPPIDVADEHDPELFLCDRRTYMSFQEEYAEILHFCRIDSLVKLGRVSPMLVEALRRGIGLYHDALNREYRRAVELLFRARYLRVVVSDLSLSMGVNMPCKTTVFAGDSTTMTPLLFRQTAGRAGRRGFDSLGHIVFWDFPFKKIRRVLCSKLPVLSGKYPIRPSSVLRTVRLAKVTDDSIIADMIIKSEKDSQKLLKLIDKNRSRYIKLLKASLFELGAPPSIFHQNSQDTDLKAKSAFDDDYSCSFAFAITLLVRLGILDKLTGVSLPMAALVEAIPSTDDGNLVLPWVLINGYLNNASTLRSILFRLYALIIERKEFTYSIVRRFELAKLSGVYSTLFPFQVSNNALATGTEWSPLLPPMPDDLIKLLEELDRILLDNGKARARAAAIKRVREEQVQHSDYVEVLPTSGLVFPWEVKASTKVSDEFSGWLGATKMTGDEQTLQSKFFAGVADARIATPQDLCQRVRHGVFLEVGSIPQILGPRAKVACPVTGEESLVPLVNSFLLELVEHQSLRQIIQHNKISASEAYFVAVGIKGATHHLEEAVRRMLMYDPAATTGDYSMVVVKGVSELGALFDTIATNIRN